MHNINLAVKLKPPSPAYVIMVSEQKFLLFKTQLSSPIICAFCPM